MAVCGTHAGIGREADRPRRARSGRTRPNSPAPPFFPVLSSSRPPPPSNGTLLELRLGGLGLACDAPGPVTALLAAAPGVQRIDLAANRLTGDIGALATAVSTAGPAVREVDLAGNALSGRLETACGFAASGALRALDVSGNAGVGGPVPACLATAPAVSDLRLSGMGLDGSLPALGEALTHFAASQTVRGGA